MHLMDGGRTERIIRQSATGLPHDTPPGSHLHVRPVGGGGSRCASPVTPVTSPAVTDIGRRHRQFWIVHTTRIQFTKLHRPWHRLLVTGVGRRPICLTHRKCYDMSPPTHFTQRCTYNPSKGEPKGSSSSCS